MALQAFWLRSSENSLLELDLVYVYLASAMSPCDSHITLGLFRLAVMGSPVISPCGQGMIICHFKKKVEKQKPILRTLQDFYDYPKKKKNNVLSKLRKSVLETWDL